MKGNADPLTEGGADSRYAIFELTKAYQELATMKARSFRCDASNGRSVKPGRTD
jgi:hypothetical protein